MTLLLEVGHVSAVSCRKDPHCSCSSMYYSYQVYTFFTGGEGGLHFFPSHSFPPHLFSLYFPPTYYNRRPYIYITFGVTLYSLFPSPPHHDPCVCLACIAITLRVHPPAGSRRLALARVEFAPCGSMFRWFGSKAYRNLVWIQFSSAVCMGQRHWADDPRHTD